MFVIYVKKVKDYEIGGECCAHGKKRNAYCLLFGNTGKIPVGRPWLQVEDIETDLKDIHGRVWFGFIWLRIGTSIRLL